MNIITCKPILQKVHSALRQGVVHSTLNLIYRVHFAQVSKDNVVSVKVAIQAVHMLQVQQTMLVATFKQFHSTALGTIAY